MGHVVMGVDSAVFWLNKGQHLNRRVGCLATKSMCAQPLGQNRLVGLESKDCYQHVNYISSPNLLKTEIPFHNEHVS